ncbi:GvpL/GvpF family gas vesicle protein [Streptomyces sp. PU-14G]|uniref:GvpL/GvpF family gas vesicle protein n=1 Tax=Streptomyces sp. PU-14G TaxID=2800808 RepID=UPI0034DEF71F
MTQTVRGPGTAPETSPATASSPAATATYVYAVCRGCDPDVLAGLSGQAPGAPVRLLRFGALEAVVQDVPAASFGEEALRERLGDRAELEHCARAHHAVIAAAAATAPTLPLPLATLYLGDGRARAALSADASRFLGALRRIAGRVEWGVKVYASREGGRGPGKEHAAGRTAGRGAPECRTAPGSEAARRPPARPGHAYLERLRGVRQEREQRQEAGLGAAEAVDRALGGLAVASRRLRSHDTAVTGGRGAQLLNAAYLVAEGRRDEVAEAVQALRESPECRGVEVELTGPWVPYSFVDGGESDARG